ncbi:MAG: ABC transporter substrate-binding protein [Bdellovibrionales bacterium]|nr:ABC transporter substrate-binding protein [Bdellovibrionales bacterium]
MLRTILLSTSLFAQVAFAADMSDLAIRLVGDMIEDAKVTAEKITTPNKPQSYCSIVKEYMSIERVSDKILGPSWRRLPDVEQQEFIRSFQSEIANFFYEKFENYLFESKIDLPKSVIDKNGRFDVRVNITIENPDTINTYSSLEFTVIYEDEQLFVVDAKMLGFSFQKIKRQEFQKYRRDIPALTLKLKEKLAEASFPLCS